MALYTVALNINTSTRSRRYEGKVEKAYAEQAAKSETVYEFCELDLFTVLCDILNKGTSLLSKEWLCLDGKCLNSTEHQCVSAAVKQLFWTKKSAR